MDEGTGTALWLVVTVGIGLFFLVFLMVFLFGGNFLGNDYTSVIERSSETMHR